MNVPVDEEYYREISSGGVAETLLIYARNRIFNDFRTYTEPSHSDQVLDVGVSDVVNDGANVLERCYSHQDNITACGLGAGIQFKKAFPLVRFIQIRPNARLPFDDNTFDIATSNAVLEHVGSMENQFYFVRELCRVARRVFISVPNRFFPIEHHTALPIVHYQDNTFQIACRITGKSEWTREEKLILMTQKRLWQLAAPIKKKATVGYTGIALGPFSSNLYLAFH